MKGNLTSGSEYTMQYTYDILLNCKPVYLKPV